jgi:hypothetical protein
MEKITQWISACLILHNLLLPDQSPSFNDDNPLLMMSLSVKMSPSQLIIAVGLNSVTMFMLRCPIILTPDFDFAVCMFVFYFGLSLSCFVSAFSFS